LSGYRVFPGGHIDPIDYPEHRDDIESAARQAAVREIHEEIGLDLGHQVSDLTFLGTWQTPPYLVFPMETYFFTMACPPKESWAPVASDEVEDGEWIRPVDALDRWENGQCLVAPPTLCVLRALATHDVENISHIFENSEATGLEPTYSAVHPDKMMIPTRTPTLPPATHTNCYILGTTELLVIEPASAPSEDLNYILKFLDDKVNQGARIRAIVLTHHHHDHIGGVETVRSRYRVPVWAHRETASRVPFAVEHFLEDGEVIELEDGLSWRILFTPGHAPGHICLIEPESRGMVVGDMVAGVGSILVEPSEGDMGDYLHSLSRIKAEDPAFLMPSHGPVIGGAAAKLDQYIEHRLARERACLDALKTHESLVGLVAEVYRDVPEKLRRGPQGGLAGLSLRAHLNKLVKDGHVVHVAPDRWVRVPTEHSAP